MKANVRYIGILDQEGNPHAVEFKPGVNVITGRSSTGKSALIEIFDYCLGSSDFTVPVGVITENASIFFVVLHVEQTALVLGREGGSKRAFLREEYNLGLFKDLNWAGPEYFGKNEFLPLRDYLKRLQRFFNIKVTDIDEDYADRERRGNKKAPTPSVRSFSSFMLQHQNLIANKHAIFYRFDQKEKREQAIDHLKVFLGFADQRYFVLRQQENELESMRRGLIRSIPKRSEIIKDVKKRFDAADFAYRAITGHAPGFGFNDALANAGGILASFRKVRVEPVAVSDEHVKLMFQEEKQKTEATAKLRSLQLELAEIESSMSFSKKHIENSEGTLTPSEATISHPACPFCDSEITGIERSANDLATAINWLNIEISKSSYRNAVLDELHLEKQKEVKEARSELMIINERIQTLRNQVKELQSVRNQYELSVEAKIRLESVLEEIESLDRSSVDDEIDEIDKKLILIRGELKGSYNIAAKLTLAENRINALMKEHSKNFDFEKAYKPINLKFSLENFDLWHEEGDRKVFLRAMGSGANWLACHLVLFLSLHQYFCELGHGSSIPAILFLDQPSQVYFPSILDDDAEFSPQTLAERDRSRGGRPVDDDIRAVTNMFDQLILYCEKVARETKIRPQIIITDHADNLKLKSGVSFDSLVRERWRDVDDGFIDMRGISANLR